MYITDNVIRNKLHGFLNKSNKKKKQKTDKNVREQTAI